MYANVAQIQGVGVVVPPQDTSNIIANKVTERRGEVVILVYLNAHFLEREVAAVARQYACLISSVAPNASINPINVP